MSDHYTDSDDLDFLLLSAAPTSKFGCLVWLVIIAIFAYCVHVDSEKCAKKTCESGQVARVLENQCLCVTEAK